MTDGFGYGGGGLGGSRDKGLQMPLMETLRLAWADPELRQRILFVLAMFAVFTLGVHIQVPIPGASTVDLLAKFKQIPALSLIDMFGGGALRRVSIFALGLNPYITASIIIQILTTAFPQWKKELQEGGEYARKTQNQRTRFLTLFLCIFQGLGILKLLSGALPPMTLLTTATVIVFWTAGAMFMLWLGEQISEKGIGNGVSLMIFAGIIISLPSQATAAAKSLEVGNPVIAYLRLAGLLAVFLATTWFVVYFTVAQRRIPIQHMRRNVGTKVLGGATSYLPLSVNMAGVIPIIFAASLIFIPGQLSIAFGSQVTPIGNFLFKLQQYLIPFQQGSTLLQSIVAVLFFSALIFFFTYFYTAVQYNVEDIADNLKRSGSFIPGVRPGKQTKDFLDGVISRITVVGAFFLATVALMQYAAPAMFSLQRLSVLGGTTLLIMVSVALETMRQIEANLLMRQYNT